LCRKRVIKKRRRRREKRRTRSRMHYRNITCIFEKPAIFPCQLNDSCGSCAFRAANNYTNQRGENNRRTLASLFINISQSVNSLPRLYVSRALCLQRLYISVTPFPCRVLACHAESSSCRLSRVKKKKRKKKKRERREETRTCNFSSFHSRSDR